MNVNDPELWNWTLRYEFREDTDDLYQGDIVLAQGCAVEARFHRAKSFIILNQSCDLKRQNTFSKTEPLLVSSARTVIVAPVIRLVDFLRKS